MSHQGILSNADGTLVGDGDYEITFDWMACGVRRGLRARDRTHDVRPSERRSTRPEGECPGEPGSEQEDGERVPESTDFGVRT